MTARYFGKYAGVVSDNADPEKRAHLKVKVPAVLGPTLEVWARPCLPFGHFFVPAVGTKIWVEFEAGDAGFPIWAGVWYAQGEVPLDAELNPPVQRMIHTPSGHAVELHDEDGEEKILIRHKSNAFLSFDKEGGVLAANKNGSYVSLDAKKANLTLVDEHGHMITLGDQGVVVAAKDGTTLVEVKEGAVKIFAAKVVQVMAESAVFNTAAVSLGKDASEPAVLGQQFSAMWNAFLFHTHPTALGPSGPPLPAPPAGPLAPGNGLSMAVKVK
jgi:hypothetical protein